MRSRRNRGGGDGAAHGDETDNQASRKCREAHLAAREMGPGPPSGDHCVQGRDEEENEKEQNPYSGGACCKGQNNHQQCSGQAHLGGVAKRSDGFQIIPQIM
ncbi:hypothetical protein GCM10027038_06210 [Arthrobacter bambusae]